MDTEKKGEWICTCGHKNVGKFCGYCGKTRESVDRSVQPQPQDMPPQSPQQGYVLPNIPQQPQQGYVPPNVPQQPQPGYQQPMYQPPQNSNKTLTTVLITVVVIALLAGVGYFAYKSGDDSGKKATPPANQTQQVQQKSDKKVTPKKDKTPKATGLDARSALEQYYSDVTNGNYNAAYNRLTGSFKNYMGSYEHFCNGYGNTLSSKPSNIQLVDGDGETRAVFTYTLEARDRTSSGKVKVQSFSETTTMVKVNGIWLMDEAIGSKLDEHFE